MLRPPEPRTLAPFVLAAAVVLGTAACGSTMSTSASLTASSATSAASSVEAAPAPADAASSPAPGTHLVTITSGDVPMPDVPAAALPATAPQRIVSLATGVGETLAALGIADRVVGRDETSGVPQIESAEVVTKAHAASAEKVLSLRPDLVIVDAATAPKEAVAQIEDAGVRVVEVPEAWALADLGPRVRAVAEAVGVPSTVADDVIAEAGGSTPYVAPSPGAARVAFLYVRGTSAIYLVGGEGSGADTLVNAAGAIDAGAAAGYDAFTPITAEAVATLDPDVILVMTKGLESVGGVDGLVALPGVAQTRAGREKRVVAVDDTLLLSFGPRTGRLVEALRSALAASLA
ncbi:MAG: ABC transporter substrate-binding protein [Actinobacteria bacterium]|nr:ABC transporter substrate-binding protein [Actinomycetota bacterium]